MVYVHNYFPTLLWCKLRSVRTHCIHTISNCMINFTVGKVFLYDVRELEKGYRVLSFFALAVVLFGVSFAYQRDWLKLSARSPEEPKKEETA